MDFWDLTRMMFRRWYVALPFLLITAAAVVQVKSTVNPDYTTTSYVQLIPPTVNAPVDKPVTGPRNPWLDLGLGSLSTAAILITRDQTFLNQMVQDGYSDAISMTIGSDAPICTILVIGNSPQQASGTTDKVIERFKQVVTQLQNDYGVKPDNMITTRRLDQGDNVTSSDAGVKRAVVVVGGIGLLLAAALSIGFDALMTRRSRRRQEDGPAESLGLPAAPGPLSPAPAVSRFDLPYVMRVNSSVEDSRTAGPLRPRTASASVPSGNQSSESDHRSTPEPTDLTEEVRVPATAEDVPVSVDATIVLPLSMPQSRGDKGGKRR